MEILVCPNCKIRVAVGDDFTCPSCRRLLNVVASPKTLEDEGSIGILNGNAKQSAEPNKRDQRKPVTGSAETHFDVFSVCLSLKGRVPRSVYWFVGIGSAVLFYFGAIAIISMFGEDSSATPLVFLLFVLLFFWTQLAISVKRFHDLGMSGFWVPLLLIPGIGQFVQFFLLGLQRGDRGENKYGRDPIELFE